MKTRLKKSLAISLALVLFAGGVCYADTDDGGTSNSDNVYLYSDAYNTGKDNGYSGYHEIDKDDMHYGWSLGHFELSGFVDKKKDADGNYIFFKNYDTKIQLDFVLEQDIDELNGDEDMYIYKDKNGYDTEFNVAKGDIERGCLIVSKTDYQNYTDQPVCYGDYLHGIEIDANTKVDMLEEGDYTVVLDYEICRDDWSIPIVGVDLKHEYGNYRIKFSFSIRNSNCMVFVRDAVTGSELPEKAFTENGFFLDLANSHYLNIYIKRSVIAATGYSLTEDTRFNAMISEGEIIDKEGLYEITVKNPASELETTKMVYVGTDPIMKAYIVTGYSLEEIYAYIQEGATITDEGEIIMPLPTATPTAEPSPTPTQEPTPSPVPTVEPTETSAQTVASEPTQVIVSSEKQPSPIDMKLVVIGIIAAVGLGAALFIVFYWEKREKKTPAEDRKQEIEVEKETKDEIQKESIVEERKDNTQNSVDDKDKVNEPDTQTNRVQEAKQENENDESFSYGKTVEYEVGAKKDDEKKEE